MSKRIRRLAYRIADRLEGIDINDQEQIADIICQEFPWTDAEIDESLKSMEAIERLDDAEATPVDPVVHEMNTLVARTRLLSILAASLFDQASKVRRHVLQAYCPECESTCFEMAGRARCCDVAVEWCRKRGE